MEPRTGSFFNPDFQHFNEPQIQEDIRSNPLRSQIALKYWPIGTKNKAHVDLRRFYSLRIIGSEQHL